MTRAELVENLGTIAHSGSKAFAAGAEERGQEERRTAHRPVRRRLLQRLHGGRQGVRSIRTPGARKASTSAGPATARQLHDRGGPGQRAAAHRAASQGRRRRVRQGPPHQADPRAYSNFVSFPIILNGERVNTVEAVWLKSKDSITDEQYNEFYKFTAHAFDDPSYRLHFQAEVPLVHQCAALHPHAEHGDLWHGPDGAGVSLYCKKVLIDPHPKKLLPEWMRFVRGVIDSEDLPLNISRESMQDSALVRKLGDRGHQALAQVPRQRVPTTRRSTEFYQSSAASSRKASPPITTIARPSPSCCALSPA
jgi:TNF receptor-associated protein 1